MVTKAVAHELWPEQITRFEIHKSGQRGNPAQAMSTATRSRAGASCLLPAFHFFNRNKLCSWTGLEGAAKSFRIGPGKLCPQKQGLRGVINPQDNDHKRTGGSIRRRHGTSPQIQTQGELAKVEQNGRK